ncbi:MAG: hypothetical protein HWE13_13605 [Gammaproteobacteria bacterium]|nr:hypothetical protein [Gammaproteobacteria bacterium]
MSGIRLFTFFIFGMLFLAPLNAAEVRSTAYDDINKILYLIQNKVRSPLVYHHSFLKLINQKLAINDVKIWVNDAKGTEYPVTIDSEQQDDGYALKLPVFPLETDDLMININQAKGDASFSLSFGINPPSNLQMNYYDLFVVLDDMNELTDEMAGAMSWFVSDRDRLIFSFETKAQVTILHQNGETIFQTDEDNRIELKREEDWFNRQTQVIFSTLPKTIEPED